MPAEHGLGIAVVPVRMIGQAFIEICKEQNMAGEIVEK